MIILTYTNQNGRIIPERELTDSEKITVTSVKTDATNITYFQGDEPVITYNDGINDMSYWDREGRNTLQYLQVRNKIWALLIGEIGANFAGWDVLSLEKKLIASKWILANYAQRIAVLSEDEDINNFSICLEETAGIFKNDLKGRSRIIEEMRQYVAINYFRKELITKANADDFYTTCNSMLNAFEKTNAIDFKYWLNNTTGTPYALVGFSQKAYIANKNELIVKLNDILNGIY